MPRPGEDRSYVGGAAQFNNIGPVPLSALLTISDLSRFLRSAFCASGPAFPASAFRSSAFVPLPKGGPKSKCLARVKIARTSAGPPSLTISDLSRFPPPLSAPVPLSARPLSARRFRLAFRFRLRELQCIMVWLGGAPSTPDDGDDAEAAQPQDHSDEARRLGNAR